MFSAVFQMPDGRHERVAVADGESLMRAAVASSIDGIMADCGGTASCATCHVIVADQYLGLVEPPNPNEEQMLEFTAAPREAGSRLSCQIVMSAALDGITVRIASKQV